MPEAVEQDRPRSVPSASLEDRLAQLEQLVQRQQEEIARLRATREDVAPSEPALIPTAAVAHVQDGAKGRTTGRSSRRRLLTTVGTAAAAATAAIALGTHQEAHAATGGNFILGQQNLAGHNTLLTPDLLNITVLTTLLVTDASALGGVNGVVAFAHNAQGVNGNDDAAGTGVRGTSNSGSGILGQSSSGPGTVGASTSGVGVEGTTVSGFAATHGFHLGSGNGVVGECASGTGVAGLSTGRYGGFFSGGKAPLLLGSNAAAGSPGSGAHSQGELFVDAAGVLWYCTGSGTPGTWVRLTGVQSGTTGGATNFLAVPIRLVDTRGFGAPITNGNSPLGSNQTMTAQITSNPVGGVSVPAGALALIGNLTALPFSNGDLTIYASGQPKPNVSNLNYNTGLNVANSVTVKLSAGGAVDIFSNVGSCNVILDVAGYIK